MLRRLSIRSKLALVVAVPVAAILAFAVVAYATFTAVRIGGDTYREIDESNDVVAEVLPPPLFIVESYLTVHQLADVETQEQFEELRNRLVRFEDDYRTRRAYWANGPLEDPGEERLRDLLTEQAYVSADKFFQIVDNEFIPAVQAGLRTQDQARARELADAELKDLYEEHRAVNIEIVQLSTSRAASEEENAAVFVRNRASLAGGILAALVLFAVGLAVVVARAIIRPIDRLRDAANEVANELVEADRDERVPAVEPIPADTSPELAGATRSINAMLTTTTDLLDKQARLRRNATELFVNLGRRNQNLVARQLKAIDEMERSEHDPESLAALFRLDHLATRMRRNAESLLVMAGLETPRRWRRPVSALDVIRSAVAEVEQYERVELTADDRVEIEGGAAANVSHLVAELVENALRFSPPDAPVRVMAVRDGDDLLVTITDHGMGMRQADLEAANLRVAGLERIEDASTAYLGHLVVGRLAARHGISVVLESPPGAGLTASVRVPASILAGGLAALVPVADRAARNGHGAALADGDVVPTEREVERLAEARRRQQQLRVEAAEEVIDLRDGAELPTTPGSLGGGPDGDGHSNGHANGHPNGHLNGHGEGDDAHVEADPVGVSDDEPSADLDAGLDLDLDLDPDLDQDVAEQVAPTGFRRRAARAAADPLDRFAVPERRARSRDADDVRDAYARFAAGRSGAKSSQPAPAPTAAPAQARQATAPAPSASTTATTRNAAASAPTSPSAAQAPASAEAPPATGFAPRRSRREAAPTPAPVEPRGELSRRERSPEDVRARLDDFSAGRTRARSAPEPAGDPARRLRSADLTETEIDRVGFEPNGGDFGHDFTDNLQEGDR